MENGDSSGLYELSGLKEIFEEADKFREEKLKIEKKQKEEDFWDGVETDFWEKEEKEKFEETIKQMNLVDNNLTINRKDYYNEVEKKMDGISNEMSKDMFEDDFKEYKEQEKPKDEIDSFWLT